MAVEVNPENLRNFISHKTFPEGFLLEDCSERKRYFVVCKWIAHTDESDVTIVCL